MDTAVAVSTILGTVVAVISLYLSVRGKVSFDLSIKGALEGNPVDRLLLIAGAIMLVLPIISVGVGGLTLGILNLFMIPSIPAVLPPALEAIDRLEKSSEDKTGDYVTPVLTVGIYSLVALANVFVLLIVPIVRLIVHIARAVVPCF